jgi:hypothetical protein
MRELAVLVADEGLKQMFQTFFARNRFYESIGCNHFDIDPANDIKCEAGQTDAAIFKRGHDLARPLKYTHRRLLVVLDRDWDGKRRKTADQIKNQIESNLARDWNEYAVVVIDPELECWVWSTTTADRATYEVHPHVKQCLAYEGERTLRQWLQDSDLWAEGESKPKDPKGAYHATIKHARSRGSKIRPSNAIFGKIVSRISPTTCVDPAFNALKEQLVSWFGESA